MFRKQSMGSKRSIDELSSSSHGDSISRVDGGDRRNVRRVFWDLETTGFLPKARIVSIGWSCDGRSEEVLVLPDIPIAKSASDIHGWTEERLREVGAGTIAAAIDKFCVALQGDRGGEPTYLCAHNGKSFDTHVLRSELERVRMVLPGNVVGFVDTMLWCRKSGMQACSLDVLATRFLGNVPRELHSAADDARLLENVVTTIEDSHSPMPPLVAHLESMATFDARTHKAAIRGVVDWLVDTVAGKATP